MSDPIEEPNGDPWAAWAEREAARLRRESELGWDRRCEEMVNEINAEAAMVAPLHPMAALQQLDQHLEN